MKPKTTKKVAKTTPKPRVPWPETTERVDFISAKTGFKKGRVIDDAVRNYEKKLIKAKKLDGEFVQKEAEIPK